MITILDQIADERREKNHWVDQFAKEDDSISYKVPDKLVIPNATTRSDWNGPTGFITRDEASQWVYEQAQKDPSKPRTPLFRALSHNTTLKPTPYNNNNALGHDWYSVDPTTGEVTYALS